MPSRVASPLLAVLLVLAPFRAAAEIPELHHLDPCTVVAVEMLENVDSSSAEPGDYFRFQTVNAVTAGNTIVIPARTMGYGIVAVASAAGRGGRAGTLVLEPRYLVLPSGYHLGVVLDHRAGDLQRNGNSGDMPGYLGAIPVPAIGAAIGAFNFFHHGKNVLVRRGTIFPIFPGDSPQSERCQQRPSY